MITLIATGHNEKGICTSDALLKIIEQISPDVIFEETSPNRFEPLYKGLLPDCLESKAIKLYLQKNLIDHFPVDKESNSITDEFIINDHQIMCHLFKLKSPAYKNLTDQWNDLPAQGGFRYLNSQQCKEFLERKLRLEGELVEMLNNEELSKRFNGWMNYNYERELEMIKNIYNYYNQKNYENGLFLVGAEHRKRIMDKIPEFEKTNQVKLTWEFNYFK